MTFGARRAGACGDGGFRGGAALRIGFRLGTLLFLRLARLFSLAFARGFVFDAAAVLRLHALAFLARSFGALALGGFSGFDFLALAVRLVLVLLVLLFENVALDVGLLVTHLDVHRARAALGARLLELALCLARQRDLARRRHTGRGLARGFGAPCERRRCVSSSSFASSLMNAWRAGDLDAGGLQLHQQPVDGDLQYFGKLRNGDVRHADSSGATLQTNAHALS